MILNVDDHEPGRYARTRLLTRAGYTVAEASTGEEALRLTSSLRPKLIMLDVNLPDINGLEVCRRIKSDPLLRSTAILQISAAAITNRDRVGGLDNGADAYLIEPVDSDVLLATIRALFRMRKAEADLADANEALQVANNLLRVSNEDLQRFAYMASHDLQEPLRTVSTYAALLERRYQGRLDKGADDFLAHIQRGTARMSLLIQRLLLYAKAGLESEGDWQSVNLNEVVASTLNDLEQSIAEAEAAITCETLPNVTGNEVLLCQLFQNIIHNALKYRRPERKPRISITAAIQTDNRVQVVVADNGIGVPAQYHTTIFAPFRRLHGFDVPGSGIGLATCQRIVERHGGRIWVESEGEDAGSRFSFTLRLDQ